MGSTSWQDSLSLKDALLHMLKNEISHDVIFNVGESADEVRCHSFILTARSHAFQAMLEGPMIDRDPSGKVLVSLPEVEAEMVQCFLRYLYTDDIELSEDNVMPLLYLARKYLVQTLIDKCQNFITDASLLEPENSIEIYHQAFLFDLEDLMADSMKIINQKTKQCLESDSFLALPHECVRMIIADDHHQVEEDTIYRNVIRWCEEECLRKGVSGNDEMIRKILGDILYEIRFPNMDIAFFQSFIEKRHILTEEEKKEVKDLLKGVHRSTYRGLFKCKPRNICQRVMRMVSCEEEMVLDAVEHAIAFESTVDCLLHGIVTYGLSQAETKFILYVKVLDDNNRILVDDDFSIESDSETQLCNVKFQKAVEIVADQKYRVSLTLDDTNWTWKGKHGRHSVPFKDGEVRFTDCGGQAEETGMLEGQIPGLLLS